MSSIRTRPDSIPEGLDPSVTSRRDAARRHWTRVAQSLPPKADVLEVGAGSCLVSRWMIAARPDLRIVASDCGDYPIDGVGLASVRFLPRTPMEAIPLGEATFDAVVSQFGFEYADRPRALTECARLVRAGGAISFLMHWASGAVHEGCALRVACARMVNDAPSIPDLLSYVARIDDIGSRMMTANLSLLPEIARRLQRLDEMEQAAGIRVPGVRAYLEGAVFGVRGAGFSRWAAEANAGLADLRYAGEEQARAALTRDDVYTLSGLARRVGFDPRHGEFLDMAWNWSATKRPSKDEHRSKPNVSTRV